MANVVIEAFVAVVMPVLVKIVSVMLVIVDIDECDGGE